MLSVVNVTKTSVLNKFNMQVHKVVLKKRMLMDPKVLFNSATVQVVLLVQSVKITFALPIARQVA